MKDSKTLIETLTHSKIYQDYERAFSDATGLPVPADVLVYTRDEWDAMQGSKGPGSLPDTVVWAYQARPPA